MPKQKTVSRKIEHSNKPPKIHVGGGQEVDNILPHGHASKLEPGQIRFSDAGEPCELKYPVSEPDKNGNHNWMVRLCGTSMQRERMFNA